MRVLVIVSLVYSSLSFHFFCFLCTLLSTSLFFSFSVACSPPLLVLPWSVLPTHSLVYCNTLHHPVQLEGMLFSPPPCILLFSCCTAWKIYLHGVWFTVGFLYNFQTEPAVYSADLKNETKYKMPDCDSWCFSVFPGAMCRGRIGGSWGLSWTGIIMRCLWRSQAAWSVCRWAAALSTATARSESTIQ